MEAGFDIVEARGNRGMQFGQFGRWSVIPIGGGGEMAASTRIWASEGVKGGAEMKEAVGYRRHGRRRRLAGVSEV